MFELPIVGFKDQQLLLIWIMPVGFELPIVGFKVYIGI